MGMEQCLWKIDPQQKDQPHEDHKDIVPLLLFSCLPYSKKYRLMTRGTKYFQTEKHIQFLSHR